MLTICLSCYFVMGKNSCIMGKEVPRVVVLDNTHILTMTRTYRDPKLSSMRCRYSYPRGMRHSTYDLSSIWLILVITLNLTIQDANDRGNESSKLISIILLDASWNLLIPASLCEGSIFYFYVESVNLSPSCLKQAFELLWSNLILVDAFNHVFYSSLFGTLLLSEWI